MIDLSADSVALRLATAQVGNDGGDFLHNQDMEGLIRANATTDAAVLIGLVDRHEPMVLLTRRTHNLRTHSGQIAFPGGRIDADDRDAVAAALRECEEETGIAPNEVSVMGRLPRYFSGSGYRITPVVARIAPNHVLRPNPDEVDAVFEVPLGFLMRPENHVLASRHWQGKTRYFFEMTYGEHRIWGVTAGIIRMMYERLFDDDAGSN